MSCFDFSEDVLEMAQAEVDEFFEKIKEAIIDEDVPANQEYYDQKKKQLEFLRSVIDCKIINLELTRRGQSGGHLDMMKAEDPRIKAVIARRKMQIAASDYEQKRVAERSVSKPKVMLNTSLGNKKLPQLEF